MEKDIKDKNYNLKSEAVETLAGADREEVPEYSQEELNRYRTPKRFQIPQWVKILLIKAWFAGAVCYFILWGLGTYIGNMLDMLFILGVVLGMVNDVLGLEASVKVRERDASITLKLPNGLGQTNESTCQTLLTALMVHFVQLAEEYPEFISVMEV